MTSDDRVLETGLIGGKSSMGWDLGVDREEASVLLDTVAEKIWDDKGEQFDNGDKGEVGDAVGGFS